MQVSALEGVILAKGSRSDWRLWTDGLILWPAGTEVLGLELKVCRLLKGGKVLVIKGYGHFAGGVHLWKVNLLVMFLGKVFERRLILFILGKWLVI